MLFGSFFAVRAFDSVRMRGGATERALPATLMSLPGAAAFALSAFGRSMSSAGGHRVSASWALMAMWALLVVGTGCSPTLRLSPPSDIGTTSDSRTDSEVVEIHDASDTAVGCSADNECASPHAYCLRSERRCVDCLTATHCASGQTCASNRCVVPMACTSSRSCPGQVCDTARSICVDCLTDDDCSSGLICRSNSCVARPPSCRSSRECSSMGLVCDTRRNECVDCVADADCPMGNYCTAADTCVRQACSPGAVSCVTGTRVRTCDARGMSAVEMDCPSGMLCAAGTCRMAVCSPSSATCLSSTMRHVCNSDGLGYTDAACAAGEACLGGSCLRMTCTPGMAVCTSMTERQVCNASGVGYTSETCTAPSGAMANCVGGACSFVCAANLEDCDRMAANGCEATLLTDAHNCGACGNACAVGQICNTGRCVIGSPCPMGMSLCGTSCVNLTTDIANCGGCGAGCPTRPNAATMCTASTCAFTCSSGYGNCDGIADNGCEQDLGASFHCGRCGNACAAGQSCRAGGCIASTGSRYVLSPSPSPASFLDICPLAGTTTVLSRTNTDWVHATIPFGFRFWDTTLPPGTTVTIASPGFMSMDGYGPLGGVETTGTIPSTSAPNGTISTLWMSVSLREACYITMGDVGSRRFIVEWRATPRALASPIIVREVVLNEVDGAIDILSDGTRLSGAVTVGVENLSGTQGVGGCSAGTTSACDLSNTTAVRFVLVP